VVYVFICIESIMPNPSNCPDALEQLPGSPWDILFHPVVRSVQSLDHHTPKPPAAKLDRGRFTLLHISIHLD
jgi:hypothetical protein